MWGVNPFGRGLVLAEAVWAKHRVKLAPEPLGERQGLAPAPGDPTSDQQPLRLVAVGDSMVAGCGTRNQSEGLVPSLARDLARVVGRPVHWQAIGRLGATMRRVRYRLLPQVDTHPDLLFLCAGSNDVMAGRTLGEWAQDLGAAVDLARERSRSVVVSSAGQPNRCPSLPHALRRAIGVAIDQQTPVSRELCARRGVTYVDITHDPAPLRPGFWSFDGFHPSAFGYRLVADAVVRRVPPTFAREFARQR